MQETDKFTGHKLCIYIQKLPYGIEHANLQIKFKRQKKTKIANNGYAVHTMLSTVFCSQKNFTVFSCSNRQEYRIL